MSDDLISRSGVIELINKFVFVGYREPNKVIREEFKKVIENMPTAYDVDKVVKQIEELGCKGCEYVGDFEKCGQDCECEDVSKEAIEIVKSGGENIEGD